ncbi:MAG: transcription termination factor Rho [Coriobacteriales bacterium]|nr:transcription termination factor Rho [Coriobacteriales bacterium]
MIRKSATDTGLIDASSIVLEPTASAEVEIPAPTPRRRGRPRKNPLPDVQVGASAKSKGASGSVDTSSVSASVSEASSVPSLASGVVPPSVTESTSDVVRTPHLDQPSVLAPAKVSARSRSVSTRGTSAKSASGASSRGASNTSSGSGSGAKRSSGNNNARSSNRSASAGGSLGKTNASSGNGNNNDFGNNGSNGSSNGGSKAKSGYQNYSRRPRRSYNNQREQVVPQTNREELAALKVAELRGKAAELELDISAIKKKEELIEAVLDAMVKAEGFVACEGILDLLPEGYGFLRTSGYLPGETDVYVGMSMVRRNGLRKGDLVTGQVRPARENEKYAALHRIDTVNGLAIDDVQSRRRFADLTPVYPDERLLMEHGINTITARTIDLVAPIGKGQRGLIVSPPKAGKTTILKDIAAAISANNPGVHLMCLLVDERPEEVTDMERSIKGEVVSSTFDMPSENHIAVAELVIERAKRLVEVGRDVVILLDSITRLARAYNLAQPASGRILSGGVDSTALYPPKRFLGAARNIEGGGSLTILASALIETGSKMDEVIFEEFKGTGNMELRLDRDLADRRIFPAIDPVASGTRKEELLLDAQEAPLIWAVRRILANMNNTERAMEMLIKSLKQTQNNAEFLMRTAKKAQQRSNVEIAEL